MIRDEYQGYTIDVEYGQTGLFQDGHTVTLTGASGEHVIRFSHLPDDADSLACVLAHARREVSLYRRADLARAERTQ